MCNCSRRSKPGRYFLCAPCGCLLSLNHFAAAQAASANADTLGRALHFGMNRAEIDVPAPLGDVVGVADVVAELRPLAANITNLCHDCSRWNQTLSCKHFILQDRARIGQAAVESLQTL